MNNNKPMKYVPQACFATHPPLQEWEREFLNFRETEEEKAQADKYIKETYGREYTDFLADDKIGFDKIQILSAARMFFIQELREKKE